MLSGRLPFQSSTLPELIQMQLTSTPTALKALRPETPPGIDMLVMRMLAKDPERRPANVWQVAREYALALPPTATDEAAREEADTLLQASPQKPATPASPHARLHGSTELMPDAPTPERFEVSADGKAAAAAVSGKAQKQAARSWLTPGLLLGVALLGGGLILYQFGSGAGTKNDQATGATGVAEALLAQSSPVPTATATPLPLPSPAAAEPVRPRPKPVAARSTPTPATIARPLPTPAPVSRPLPEPPKAPFPNPPAAGENRELLRRRLAQQQFTLARQLYEQGRYQVALRSCNAALRYDPQNAEAATLKRKIQVALRILNER
jgi:serine/threonine-protein kinase